MSPKLSKETEDIYILSAQDRSIVSTARDLLWKIVYASIARPHQLVGVAKALHVLSRLPQTTPKITVSVSLVGPRRWFGEHEIYHWWDVGITPHEISISAAGHFHTESSGGDTFTSMQWAAQPGAESDFSDYLLDLSIVDDAQPFESEINKLDLTAEAYSLEVTDESTDIAGDEGINDEEDDPAFSEQAIFGECEEELESAFSEHDVNDRRITYANPSEHCDMCHIDLEPRRLFVDGVLRGRTIAATMCARCFYRYGEGIGWGKGQLYKKQIDGKWLLCGGFPPADQ